MYSFVFLRPECDELCFPSYQVLCSVGIWIYSVRDLFSSLPAVYFHWHLSMLFYKWWVSWLELNAFVLLFLLKNFVSFKKSTSVFWFSKLVLLYGGKSVKLATLKHVSLRLNMISKCYFYLYCFWYGKILSLFLIVPDIFRKNQNKHSIKIGVLYLFLLSAS